MRYGYINGKWLRAKRLHVWMWQLLYGRFDGEADVPDYNNQYAQRSMHIRRPRTMLNCALAFVLPRPNILCLHEMIRSMPLSLYCEVIGVPGDNNPELEVYGRTGHYWVGISSNV